MEHCPETGPATSLIRRRKYELLAAGGYVLLSCFYAFRVVAQFSSHLAGHGGDGFQNLWNMWWFKESLLSGSNPYFTHLLYHPYGTTLLFHTLNPFNCLLAMPLEWLFGQPAAYNFVFLFSFAASGFTMYLLVRELSGDHLGAFLAGCVFTFSHYHFAHAQGHLNLTAMEWFPLFVLGLVRVWRRRRLRDGALMGVALALTTFCDLYYTVFALFLAASAALLQLVRNRSRVFEKRVVSACALGAGIFLVTGGVLVIAMLVKYLQVEFLPTHNARRFSADLQGFFVPGWISMYGDGFHGVWSRWTGNSAECCWYLGYSVLGLASLAFVLGPRKERPWAWALLGLSGMVLALGPVLHWGGKIYDGVPLPFRWFNRIVPLLKISGVPGRWHFLTLVSSAVLAGAGATALRRRLLGKKLWRIPAGTAALTVALVLVLAELMPRFVAVHHLAQPDFAAVIRAQPQSVVVYDLGDDNDALLRQIAHQHPMFGGYISRPTRANYDFVRRDPHLRALRGELKLPAQEVQSWAKDMGLRYLIVPVWHRANRTLPELGARVVSKQWHLQFWELPGF